MPVEDPNCPSVWMPQSVERPCRGDLLGSETKWQDGQIAPVNGATVNSDLVLQNRFSIIADTFAMENVGYIRWLLWHGTKWKVNSVNIKGRRIILYVGGVYNGR